MHLRLLPPIEDPRTPARPAAAPNRAERPYLRLVRPDGQWIEPVPAGAEYPLDALLGIDEAVPGGWLGPEDEQACGSQGGSGRPRAPAGAHPSLGGGAFLTQDIARHRTF